MIEFLFTVLQFIVWLPARIVCLALVIITFPLWIWLKETRATYSVILWRLIYSLDLKGKETDDETIYV